MPSSLSHGRGEPPLTGTAVAIALDRPMPQASSSGGRTGGRRRLAGAVRWLDKRLPRELFEHPLAGLVAAMAMGLADVVRASLDVSAQRVTTGEFAIASFHLVILYLPLGLAVGIALGLAHTIVRRTPWLSGVRSRLGRPRAWVEADPTGFAAGLGVLVALGLAFQVSGELYIYLVTHYHRPELTAYGMAGGVLGLFLGGTLLAAAITVLVRPLARFFGRLASPLGLTVLALATATLVGLAALARHPQVLSAYDVEELAWGPAAGAAYLVTALGLGWLFRRGGRRGRPRFWASLAVALTIPLFLGSALTYGRSNRVRSVVEQRTVLGRRLVRRYVVATDLDGDRFAWAFGGQDCDDGNPQVYPGAYDVPGDGIDADCFMGDGSPEVADLSNGEYGRVPAGPPRPNVVLVTIDALRPDHLGYMGYERDTSPNIDAFAEGAVRFETVLAQASRSLRSIPSMMTGFYPSQIAFGPEYLWPALLPENELLPEILHRRGYSTAATIGTDYFYRVDGFFQGIEDLNQIMIYKPPRPRAVDEGLVQLRRLAEGPSPFFLWIHLFNVHAVYLWDRAPSRFGPDIPDAYDTEVFHADHEFQRVLDAVTELGLDPRTIVVLASDHGEALGDHGVFGHSTTMYEPEILSTLAIRAPGIAPRTVEGPVALMDLTPTLLNLVGIPVPQPMPARSLVPFMTGQREVERERRIFGELLPDGQFPFDIKVLRQGSRKLIWWVREGTYQLFDVVADPEEMHDLSDEHREEADHMLGMLRVWVAETSRADNRTAEILERNRLSAPPEHMSHELGLQFASFRVLGIDLPRTTYRPGETIPLDLYYQVESTTDRDLFFNVRLEGPPGYRDPGHFHCMHYPLHSRYRTGLWRAGEFLRDPCPIVVPTDTPTPVRLRVQLDVVDAESGERLVFQHLGRGEQVVHITDIEIRD